MKTAISTSNYEFAHGKKPRGEGLWAFKFIYGYLGQAVASEEFTPKSMSYSAAKKWAQGRADELNAIRVSVLA